MRTTLLFALVAFSPLALPHPASGQAADTRSNVDVIAFAGLGSGPTPSATLGLGAEVPLNDFMALKAEYSRWFSGIGYPCFSSWPESYGCSVGGWAVLGGLRLNTTRIGRVEPFAEVLGGGYQRDQEGAVHRSTALGLGVGADIRLRPDLSIRVGGRYMRPFDDAFAALMAEDLRYIIGTVGLQYSVTW